MTRCMLLPWFMLAAVAAAPVRAYADACRPCRSRDEDEEPEASNLVETAAEAGSFNTLLSLVKAADLVETLESEGPFTVFAPTDDAFGELPAGTLEKLLANPDRLRDILLYHVVPGRVTAADVAELSSAKTVQGDEVKISVTKRGVKVNRAAVVKTDIESANGVIHVIDSVLLPAS